MSNRFHNKWHRKNHHTYGNLSNPDASHDPIASSDQPFLGEFVLQGALCAVAPMSAFAGYFYSNFTALCAFAGYRAIQAKAFSFPGGDSIGLQVDSQNIAISAYAPAIGLNVYSMKSAVSAYGKGRGAFIGSDTKGAEIQGGSIGAEIYSDNKAISANGFLMGAEIFSNRRAISAYGSFKGAEIHSPNLGVEVYSNQRAISAYGSAIGAEIYSPNVGISAYSPRIAIRAIAPNKNQNYTNIRALDVTGYSYFDGDVEITGSLSANGYISRLDTYVVVTSSTYIENKGTDTALTVIQRGNVPVAHFYDDGNSAFFIDGTPTAPGYVGINTATPNERLTVVGNISGYSDHVSFNNSRAYGSWSFSEGMSYATGNISHAEGLGTNAQGNNSHSEGNVTTTYADNAHAEGWITQAFGNTSHAEGYATAAYDFASHAEGGQTIALSAYSHAEGDRTKSEGLASHAEGSITTASGDNSHAEGSATSAIGSASHAEGFSTTASGNNSHAEGSVTSAIGSASHAEGFSTTASGNQSHAEGNRSEAKGQSSHAAGYRATAAQENTYAWSGDSTLAQNVSSTLSRQYFIYAPSGVYIPRGMVGIGTGTDYPNIGYPLTVNGRISSKGIDLWNSSSLKFGYFPAFDDGAEMFFQADTSDYGRLIIQTIDNADSTIVLRQRDQNGPNNYNRLVVGSDGNVGIGTGTLTSIETFNTNLAIYGTLSSYSAYVGDRLYFGSGLTPNISLYRNSPNTLRTDNNLIVSEQLSAKAIQQGTILAENASTYVIPLSAEAYRVYPITTTTVIEFSGMQAGRTTNVLLSSYVGTAQTIGPDPRFIYLDGRPTSLPAGKVLLFEIVSFGTAISSVVIKSKIQP